MDTAPASVTHVYRVRFWRLLLVGAVFAQLLYAAFVWITNGVTAVRLSVPLFSEMNLIAYVIGSVCITVLMFPAFLLLVYYLPVKVSADMFACPNAFGTLVAVPWDSITAVRAFTIPGFPYLLLSVSGRTLKLWLPLCLGRFPEFVEKVGENAGQDHLLYQALWPRVEQK